MVERRIYLKKVCVLVMVLCLCLFSCAKEFDNEENNTFTIKCEKQALIGEEDYSVLVGNYILGYVVMDGKLNRVVHVKEFMKDSYSSLEEYEDYMDYLQDAYLLAMVEGTSPMALTPYYEPDRIVYPCLILDYTDLEKYTETEVPTQVRTADGKSIDFALYWEYIQQNGVLDGFVCTLEK